MIDALVISLSPNYVVFFQILICFQEVSHIALFLKFVEFIKPLNGIHVKPYEFFMKI